MPTMAKAGSLKDPHVAQLFSTDDPEKVFSELREIGHGSFGAVYYAKNEINKEVVAIKKMSYSGKQSSEKWQDIVKEVKFLRELKHKNIIEYKGCYLRDHTAWLVMEYCVGSASDVIEVHKQPLREDEIGAICRDSLEGLDYLHKMDRIHRDVKAGNVLLTERGIVKLADFGSASLASPANSFVGTPYWMAPEVILAMDEGLYDGKVDIWSLGITCVELAERKPPLFNMNAMSALYHIAQNPSPALSGGNWSDDFRDFVSLCLEKATSDRPTARELLGHIFITRSRSTTTITELINRTKEAVRNLDKQSYSRVKKIFMGTEQQLQVENNENNDINGPQDTDSVGEDSIEDNTSSKSNSVASQHSIQSSSEISNSSMNSLPGNQLEEEITTFASRRRGSGGSGGNEASHNNFATIRTTSIVTQQKREYEHENHMRDQMTGYKRMRRSHQKQLQQLENKLRQEMEDHKQKLDKEYDQLMQAFSKELDRIRLKQQNDIEKETRRSESGEKRLSRNMLTEQDKEMKQFTAEQRKDYLKSKEQVKKSFDAQTPKKVRDDTIRSCKENLQQQHASAEGRLQKQHKDTVELEIRKFRRRRVLRMQNMQLNMLRDELDRRQAQMDVSHKMLLRHHESTQDLEYRHLSAIQRLREDQLRRQHQHEKENQQEYNNEQLKDLKRRHGTQVKQQPKSLKVKEQQIRRQFQDTVKIQQRQYKALKEQILQTTPKLEQKAVIKKLKEEKMRKLSMLGEQYESSITEMMQQQNIKLDETQLTEANELSRRLHEELELLTAYQSQTTRQMEVQHQKERKMLEDRVSLRRALLEQKMEEELRKISQECEQRQDHLLSQQHKELQEFDLQTTTMGLDTRVIMEATQDSYEEDYDLDSVRGSRLSLTPSTSSNSFYHSNTNL